MLTDCAECTRLWRIYHAATVEEIRAYKKLAGAKLKMGNPGLIAALSAHADTLSHLVTATSVQVAEHRAVHGPARQPSLQFATLQSVVQSNVPTRCPNVSVCGTSTTRYRLRSSARTKILRRRNCKT